MLMFRKLSIVVIIMTLLSIVPFLNSSTASAESTFQQRIASIMNDEEQVRLVFYLDTDGYANYEQKAIDALVEKIQEKLPVYAKLKFDSQFLGGFDLFREEKYDALLKQMYAENNAALLVQMNNANAVGAGGTQRVKVTEDVLKEYLQDSEYDGVVIVRVDRVQERVNNNVVTSFLIGWGAGMSTKVEMDVTIRVFNKNSDNKYVFSNKQRVVGKVSGAWAPETAAKRALPEALKGIDKITVK